MVFGVNLNMAFQTLFSAAAGAADSVDYDCDEADERQAEADVHCGMPEYGSEVDDAALKRRQDGTSDDGHHEEGRSQSAVFG